MKNAVVKALTRLAGIDQDLVLIAGDLGFGVLDEFREKYPERFFNAGISEQAMASIAAGLAVEGKKVYLYSIGNFPTLRCIEQVRNDICGHQAAVTILAAGGGFAYGSLGMSHHATEDFAMMRSLAGMKVLAPADPIEARALVEAAYKQQGPCYIRLNKGGEQAVHTNALNLTLGQALAVRAGEDVCMFAAGAVLQEAVAAANMLSAEGIEAALYSFCSIKPIDRETIRSCAARFSKIVTIEEHNVIGGFGSAVSEVVTEMGAGTEVVRLGFQDDYTYPAGSQAYLRRFFGIDGEAIAAAVRGLR